MLVRIPTTYDSTIQHFLYFTITDKMDGPNWLTFLEGTNAIFFDKIPLATPDTSAKNMI